VNGKKKEDRGWKVELLSIYYLPFSIYLVL